MHMEAFVFFQPRLHLVVFVSRVVVDDRVQLKVLGRFSADLFEEIQPFLMPVLVLMLLIKRPKDNPAQRIT